MKQGEPVLWQRWEEVDRLLAEALDLGDAEREHHVRSVAAADPELRDLVLRLLRRIEDDPAPVIAPAHQVVKGAFPDLEAEGGVEDFAPGTTIGRYRVVRRCGRGGMATVYEAERADGTYEQTVALKVLRRGLDTDDLIHRFLVERQILSSLSHPNIARLLDGGSTPDGRPFLVLEFVDGETITTWADRHQIDLDARLRLFLGVANAVHDAHQQLVVHRDLKPSNIMVDGAGRVKLLDFGIAKLLVGDGELTDVGVQPLTPTYASPEQLQGARVTTATDVYQLGLVLQELLTGVAPTAGESPSRASRAVTTEGASGVSVTERAASRATTPARLARLLSGDLDVIIGKALRSVPSERYASANDFAADIRRYLRKLPIAAHAESRRYRARKFVARHPWVAPTMALALLAIAAYVGTLVEHNRRLQQERDTAAAASRLAQETQAFLVALFRSADPYQPADPERGRNITVVEALQLGAIRVEEELAGQPALQASLLGTIGSVFSQLDQVAQASDAITQAIALRISLGDTTSTTFADNLASLGFLLANSNKFDTANVVLAHRLRLERAASPVNPERVADALLGIAQAQGDSDPLAAIVFTEEAVALLRAANSPQIGAALRRLSDDSRRADRLEESEIAAREALAMLERQDGPESASAAMAAHSLGQTLGMRGAVEEASQLIRRSINTFDQLLGRDHAFTMAMRNSLAVLLITEERYAEAEAIYLELLDARLARFGEEHSHVAGTYQNLSTAVAGQGRYREAEALTRKAEAIYRRVMPTGSVIVAFPMLTRSEILLQGGDAGGAAQAAAGAAAVLRGKVPTTHPAAIIADCRLGRARALQGNRSAALALLESAVARLDGAQGVRDAHIKECRSALSQLKGG